MLFALYGLLACIKGVCSCLLTKSIALSLPCARRLKQFQHKRSAQCHRHEAGCIYIQNQNLLVLQLQEPLSPAIYPLSEPIPLATHTAQFFQVRHTAVMIRPVLPNTRQMTRAAPPHGRTSRARRTGLLSSGRRPVRRRVKLPLRCKLKTGSGSRYVWSGTCSCSSRHRIWFMRPRYNRSVVCPNRTVTRGAAPGSHGRGLAHLLPDWHH